MATGDLITQSEYLTATGRNAADLQALDTAQIAWQISAASSAIRAYTDRDFTLQSDAVAGPRDFRYEGYGSVEIDDCGSINTVSIAQTPWNVAYTLDPSEWYAGSYNNPDGIIDGLEVYAVWNGMSPEMGFKNNLDTIGYVPYPRVLTVDALWGWPQIPQRVKQAAVITVTDAIATAGIDDEYNSQSIQGYSYSRGTSRASVQPVIQALPGKAIALLDGYIRLNV